jgi:chemotaxis protein MotB
MREPSVASLAPVRRHAPSGLMRSVADPVSHDEAGWLITLSDLTLLLLCFLAVWYVKQQERVATARPVKPAVALSQDSSAPEAAPPVNAEAQDWQGLKDEIAEFIAEAGMRGDVQVEAAAEEIIISFKDSIPFASGKADLNPQALPVLEKVAAVAVSRPAMYLKVNGHTDDRPISTTEFPSNWELSSARASRVARHLIERGVHPTRIEVHGFAYHRPRAGNDNQSGRGANRRVEISLLRSSGAKTKQASRL